MKKRLPLISFVLFLIAVYVPSSVFAQSAPKTKTTASAPPMHMRAGDVLQPNNAGGTLTIPGAGGAHSNVAFAGVGYTNPQAYSKDDDAGLAFGFGVGNPQELAGLEVALAVNDVSEFDNLSWGLKVHRYIGNGTTVAIGGDSLFPQKESDANETFYVVATHAMQQYESMTPGRSKMQVTLGIGSGRFANKSGLDASTGKGEDGTYLFGGVAYEVYDATNIIVDWNGINLNAGVSASPLQWIPALAHIPLVVSVGAADLTDYSGDDVRLIVSAGVAYKLF